MSNTTTTDHVSKNRYDLDPNRVPPSFKTGQTAAQLADWETRYADSPKPRRNHVDECCGTVDDSDEIMDPDNMELTTGDIALRVGLTAKNELRISDRRISTDSYIPNKHITANHPHYFLESRDGRYRLNRFVCDDQRVLVGAIHVDSLCTTDDGKLYSAGHTSHMAPLPLSMAITELVELWESGCLKMQQFHPANRLGDYVRPVKPETADDAPAADSAAPAADDAPADAPAADDAPAAPADAPAADSVRPGFEPDRKTTDVDIADAARMLGMPEMPTSGPDETTVELVRPTI